MTYIPPGTQIYIHSLDQGTTVNAQYNPKELQIDKTVPWQKHNKSGATGLQMEYTGAEGRDMTLELMFDGYEENESVRDTVRSLEDMATEKLQKDNTRRPDHCFVAWGEIMGGGDNKFKCVIIQISTKYTMFSNDGKALRATVTLKLKEADAVSMGSGGAGA
jgi:Contractile injection system tube protein